MRKRVLFGQLLLFFLAVFFLFSPEERTPTISTVISTSSQSIQRNLDSEAPQPAENPQLIDDALEEENPLSKKIQQHKPTRSPAALADRWGQVKTFEDDKFIGTQLTFDNRPVENYFYRWRKDGNSETLSAGTLPELESVKGAFPNTEQVTRVAETMIGSEGEILSVQEVWSLNSMKTLSPQIKVEVQSKSQGSGRNSGHEYWFISLNSGKIVKRVEADRY